MFFSFLPVLPIVVTIVVFLLVRRTYFAIFSGCLTAALVVTGIHAPHKALWLLLSKFLQANQLTYFASFDLLMTANRLPLYLFIVFLNIYISLIQQSGIAYGYYNFLSGRLKSKVGAEMATIALGFLLFVDDYLSIISNTKVSRIFCGRFKIPRLKVCLLAACIAGPLCSLIPISSWGADILNTISTSINGYQGLGMDAFFILISAAPFMFFSLLMVVASFVIVLRRYSFGLVLKEELDLEASQTSNGEDVPARYLHFNLGHFLFPVLSMIGMIILAMLVYGGYFGSELSVFGALKSNPYPEKSLLVGTIGALLLVLVVFAPMRLVSLSNTFSAVEEGVSESLSILAVLSFSATFAAFIKLLGTGELLCSLAEPFISAAFLPASIFIITSGLAFLVSSSWATINIVVPTILPMVIGILTTAQAPAVDIQNFVVICIGAVISGAVFGAGLSPISDLLNMASKSCQVPHAVYLKAQCQYSLLVGVAACASFVISGFLVSKGYWYCWGISFAAGFSLMALLFQAATVISWRLYSPASKER